MNETFRVPYVILHLTARVEAIESGRAPFGQVDVEIGVVEFGAVRALSRLVVSQFPS